jgi:hypothetical protein
VVEKLNGTLVEEMRLRNIIPPRGTANIKDFFKRLLRPDKANAAFTLVCFINPEACGAIPLAWKCAWDPCAPECRPPVY